MTDMKHITIHSTTTCQPCKTAKKRMDAAGIPYTEVILDLPENADYLADLKRRLERDIISTPLIQLGTKFGGMSELTQIMADYRSQEAAA